MISYRPLQNLMEQRGISYYYLRYKCGDNNINNGTIHRLKNNQSVSTNTIDVLCTIFDCNVDEIIEYIRTPQAED